MTTPDEGQPDLIVINNLVIKGYDSVSSWDPDFDFEVKAPPGFVITGGAVYAEDQKGNFKRLQFKVIQPPPPDEHGLQTEDGSYEITEEM